MFSGIGLFLFHSYSLKESVPYKFYIGFCLTLFAVSQFYEVFLIREQNNNIMCEIIENMVLSASPIMMELIGASEKEDFKELIVSK